MSPLMHMPHEAYPLFPYRILGSQPIAAMIFLVFCDTICMPVFEMIDMQLQTLKPEYHYESRYYDQREECLDGAPCF